MIISGVVLIFIGIRRRPRRRHRPGVTAVRRRVVPDDRQPADNPVIAWLAIAAVAIIPIAIVVSILALIVGVIASSPSDLGEGLFADRDV
jgi:ABC-type Fe3+ transport system permease subunit